MNICRFTHNKECSSICLKKKNMLTENKCYSKAADVSQTVIRNDTIS